MDEQTKAKVRRARRARRVLADLGIGVADLVAVELQEALGETVEYCTGLSATGVATWATKPVATTREEAERYAANWLEQLGDAAREQVEWHE